MLKLKKNINNRFRQLLVFFATCFLQNISSHRIRKRFAKFVGPYLSGTIAKTAYGFPMIIRWHDNMNRISFEGSYGIIEQFVKSLNKKALFIDIGANHGCISILASKYLKESGLVMAFEPSPSVYEELQKNIKLNNCKNILTFNKAVSDVKGDFFLNETNLENSGASHISKNGTKIKAGPVYLSDIKKVGNYSDIFIKIDTEGYELNVLKGLADTLVSGLVRKLVIEIDEDNLIKYNASKGKIYDYLYKYGFKPIGGGGELKSGHYDEVFTED
jgi:FkbM family methyltransferase